MRRPISRNFFLAFFVGLTIPTPSQNLIKKIFIVGIETESFIEMRGKGRTKKKEMIKDPKRMQTRQNSINNKKIILSFWELGQSHTTQIPGEFWPKGLQKTYRKQNMVGTLTISYLHIDSHPYGRGKRKASFVELSY